MIIYPAIDLCGGECVRLYRGEFAAKTVYSSEPVEIALGFRRQGASWLHVVDLDGAREGTSSQTDTILALAELTELKLQVGGGLRDEGRIAELLDGGVERVVVGSRAVEQPEKAREWLSGFGAERVAIALDVRLREGVPFPATRGWRDESAASLWDLLAVYGDSGARHLLCTDIERDGTLEGPNRELYSTILRRFPGFEVQASGGVSSLEDLRSLKQLPVAGAIVGKALYEKRFALSEALAC